MDLNHTEASFEVVFEVVLSGMNMVFLTVCEQLS